MKQLAHKYWHIAFALYMPVYLLCFFYLEKLVTTDFVALNSPIDDIIPFVDAFIVPYILWFIYVAVGCVFFFFASQREFIKLMLFLIFGMTLYLFICYIYPNGLRDFRPFMLNRNSLFYPAVHWLYSTDTSTNVFPSIHVYNSLAIHTAIMHSSKIHKRWIKDISLILCVLICLSTMFLKQHSVIDVIGGSVMAALFYRLIYRTEFTEFINKHTAE